MTWKAAADFCFAGLKLDGHWVDDPNVHILLEVSYPDDPGFPQTYVDDPPETFWNLLDDPLPVTSSEGGSAKGAGTFVNIGGEMQSGSWEFTC
jgi:hypothetical protein